MPSTQVLKALPNHKEGQERGPGASQPQLDQGNDCLQLGKAIEQKILGKKKKLQITLAGGGGEGHQK